MNNWEGGLLANRNLPFFSVSRPARRHPPRQKIPLKIRHYRAQLLRRLHQFKSRIRREHRHHLLEIVLVIRPQINHAPGSQRPPHYVRKPFIDQPVLAMLPLRPRVWKINVQCAHRSWRQEVLQEIARFNPHPAQIGQTRPQTFPIQLSQSPQQTLHSNKIPLRMQLRVIRQKRPISAAEFNFQRFCFGKNCRQIDSLNNRIQRQ